MYFIRFSTSSYHTSSHEDNLEKFFLGCKRNKNPKIYTLLKKYVGISYVSS
jgi:hypothetical protein